MLTRRKILIVGSGMAGLATAYHLREQTNLDVHILEQESMPCVHSSGRNAAIFRQFEYTRPLIELALRSRFLLDQLFQAHSHPWLMETGAVYLSRQHTSLKKLWQQCQHTSLEAVLLDAPELRKRLKGTITDDKQMGVYLPTDGVMDIHGITAALLSRIKKSPIQMSFDCTVSRLTKKDSRVTGVELSDGRHIEGDAVVIAGGAWAENLGRSVGAPLPLTPLRRHLVWLSYQKRPLETGSPVLWCLDDEVYIRPEGSGYLASPCDEEKHTPCIPPTEMDALASLEGKLRQLSPALAEGGVGRAWACLRTFAADRDPVIGPDPRVKGLFWLAGLGGHGMTLGMAAGEILAAHIGGDQKSAYSVFLPSRLLPPPETVSSHAPA